MNPLQQIPAPARNVVYAVLSLAGLVLGGFQTAYLVAGGPEPAWLAIALAVLGYVTAATGATAKANTPKTVKK